MLNLRPILALSLALMLAFTSLSLAVARGQAPAVGVIEICSGHGMQMFPVDADGNPTGPAHVCPDGVAAMVSVDFVAPVPQVQRARDGEDLSIPHAADAAAAPATPALARGPPRPV